MNRRFKEEIDRILGILNKEDKIPEYGITLKPVQYYLIYMCIIGEIEYSFGDIISHMKSFRLKEEFFYDVESFKCKECGKIIKKDLGYLGYYDKTFIQKFSHLLNFIQNDTYGLHNVDDNIEKFKNSLNSKLYKINDLRNIIAHFYEVERTGKKLVEAGNGSRTSISDSGNKLTKLFTLIELKRVIKIKDEFIISYYNGIKQIIKERYENKDFFDAEGKENPRAKYLYQWESLIKHIDSLLIPYNNIKNL